MIHFHATVLSSIQLYEHLCSCDAQTKIEKDKFKLKVRWNITCINMQGADEIHQLFISKCNEVKTKATFSKHGERSEVIIHLHAAGKIKAQDGSYTRIYHTLLIISNLCI